MSLLCIFLGLSLQFGATFARLAYPRVLGQIVEGLSQGAFERTQALYLIALFGGIGLVQYSASLLTSRSRLIAEVDLKAEVFSRMLSLPLYRIKERGESYFAHLLDQTVRALFMLLTPQFFSPFFALIRLIPLMLMVYRIHPSSLLFFGIAFALMTLNYLFGSKVFPRFSERVLEKQSRMAAFFQESFASIILIWSSSYQKKSY